MGFRPENFFTRSRSRLFFVSFRPVSPDQPPLVMGGALPKPAFGQVSPTMPPTWGDSQQLKPVKLDDLMRRWNMYIYIYIRRYWLLIYTYVPSWELTVSLPTTFLKMIFLCKRWDMLVPWRVWYIYIYIGLYIHIWRFEIQYWKNDGIGTCTMLVPFGWKINARIWSIERHLMHRYFNWERTHLKC